MRNDEDIIQIIPAVGWRAVFASEDGWHVKVSELACWALHAGGYISPQYADCDGCVHTANDEANFVGIIEPSNDMGPIEIQQWAHNWRESQQAKIASKLQSAALWGKPSEPTAVRGRAIPKQ